MYRLAEGRGGGVLGGKVGRYRTVTACGVQHGEQSR